MIPKQFTNSEVPHKPGVYIFRNTSGKVLYVGKAVDLYHRVSSYFSIEGLYKRSASPKTIALVGEVASLETIIVESELEALILEANLIKKHLPPYNIRLTDDKDYLYIKITNESFPKVMVSRKKELSDALDYFGPFPSSKTVRYTLKVLRRVFPWCLGGDKRFGSRPCFYYHLGLCPGVCTGEIGKKDYMKIIYQFRQFMSGKREYLANEITKSMKKASGNQDFEEALRYKKILDGINYLLQPNHVQVYLENPNFLEDQRQRSLKELQVLLNLGQLPSRIEGYDISNIQGKNATGSMVVLTDGEIDKSQYRKFKIIISGKPNDVGMMGEMIKRRFNHSEWLKPDLILVDGGRGQVNNVTKILASSHQKNWRGIKVFGLAKRAEWLYSADGEIIKLKRSSLALKLLQKLRDEAHRFAITYHRKLRQKGFFDTV